MPSLKKAFKQECQGEQRKRCSMSYGCTFFLAGFISGKEYPENKQEYAGRLPNLCPKIKVYLGLSLFCSASF